jgi:hypothetical protein
LPFSLPKPTPFDGKWKLAPAEDGPRSTSGKAKNQHRIHKQKGPQMAAFEPKFDIIRAPDDIATSGENCPELGE